MTDPVLALGIDAGGTETRWALAHGSGAIVAEGQVRGFSALQVGGAERPLVEKALEQLAREVLTIGKPVRVHAGLTGFGNDSDGLRGLIARPLGLEVDAIGVGSDIETAYLDLFEPGEGYVVYAGTGSVAAFVDERHAMHRAGGRGVIIDDAGGGYWIAREALRHVWRAEDERPGCWRASALATELFEMMGGSDYAHTRRYVYEGTRGDIGTLALAVARSAERDAASRAILAAAGAELARLARIMLERFGPRPVALSGRAASLHPLVFQSMRAAMPSGAKVELRPCRGHHAAAHLALRAARGAAR